MTLRIHTRMRVRIQVLSMLTVLFSLMGARPAAAQYFAARGWCESGAQPIVTSGLISTTLAQASYPQCTVTVFNTGGGLATIYSSESGAALSNPFTAQTKGQWIFFAAASSSSTATYDVTLSGAGMPSTVTYSAIALGGGGGGGGGGSPAGPAGSLQFANSAVNGFASVSSVGVNSIVSPTQLNLGLNTAISGPRPYIDVTAPPYNADPTFTTFSTSAIQSAITAACAIGVDSGRPGIYFPPGQYKVEQTQTGTSTTAPIFTICSNLYIYSNGSQGPGGQFAMAPEGAAITVIGGGSPNSAPMFLIEQMTGVTIENLALNCYNQCAWAYDSNDLNFKNNSLLVDNTSQADNVPLKITNSDWIWVTGGTLQSASSTLNTLLLTGETSLTGETPLVGHLFVRDVVTLGGSFQYQQRVTATSQAGTWSFRNTTQEGTAQAYLTISESSPGLLGTSNFPSLITFDTADQSDTVGGTSGELLLITSQNQALRSINATNSVGTIVASTGGNLNSAITNFISSGSNRGTYQVNNSSLIGTQLLGTTEGQGFDITSQAQNQSNPGTNPTNCSGLFSDCGLHGLPAFRFISNGSNYATLAMDASSGVQFGGGNSQGFTAALQQSANSPATLDVLVTKLPAPTNVTVTPTTGGSLANGNYYVTLWATSNNLGGRPILDCFSNPLGLSSTMIASPFPVTVSGGNNAVLVNWTPPVAGPTSPQNYCMQVVTSDPNPNAPTDKRVFQGLEFTAPATSFLYTGQTQTLNGNAFLAQTILTPVHRFTYNSLGVNTLSPAFNLDVNGTMHASGLVTFSTLSGGGSECVNADAMGKLFTSSIPCNTLIFQNAGVGIGNGTTFNCSTNTTCSNSGGVITITASSTASTAWSTLTASTNNNAGTFVSTNNSWDYGGASGFKLPSAGANYPGSASGTVLVVAQAAAGTPTVTWGTNTGTPAVTATAPLVINTGTGNMTVSAATTGATGVIQLAGDLAGTGTSPTVVSTHITGFTQNAITKFNSTGNVINSTATDTGSLYTIPEPLDLTSNPLVTEIANAGSTGTTLNKLASLTGAPSTAVITTAASTSGAIGCVAGNAGTIGNAQIAVAGQATCTFDGGTTAGDYVQISASVNGDVTDAGASYPTSGQVLGLVLSTNASTGAYKMLLFGSGAQGFSGGGGSGTVGNCLTSTAVAYYPSSGTTTGCLSSITEAAGVIHIGTAGSVLGQLTLAGSSSGTITIQPQAAAGTYNFNLPTTAGTANAPLLSGGGGATAQSYSSILYLTSLTSGGIVYGSSTTQLASSALLPAGDFVLGGGAGSAPTASFSIVPAANGGTGVASPTAHSDPQAEGSSPYNFVGPGLTGQIKVATNAADPSYKSSGLGGRTVSGATDTILCDSGTATRDRGTTITYTDTVNVAITVPSAAATGCGSGTQGDSNFYFATLIAPASGTATYTFTPTTSTLTVINGSIVTTAATSLVLNPGQYATWSSPDNVNYIVRVTGGGSATPSGSAGGALAGTYPNPTLANATSCTNQFVSAISSSTAAGTCTTVTPAFASGNTSGSGNFCLVTNCVMTTPNLGTPSALVLTNATSLPCAAMPALTSDVTTPGSSCATTIANNAVTGAKMANNTVTATQLAAQYSKRVCPFGLGDGTNAITAATYPSSGQMLQCVNNSGATWTITGIHCLTDNAGTSTLNAYNNAGTSLLTGAITCNATKTSGGAAGTQSATTTIANTDGINFVFVADGTSKYVTATVDFTY